MQNRTWNMTLAATDEFPETRLEGVAQEDALQIMRGLMYGPASNDYQRVTDALSGTRKDEPIAA